MAAALTSLSVLLTGMAALGVTASPASSATAGTPDQASVTVLKDLVTDPTGRTVQVTGSGFHPSGVQGTVLLKDRPAGTFVLFGRMPVEWAPSKGVPSSVRMAGRDGATQKWAVLAEDMDAITDDSHEGATELSPDGTFTTTITVDRNFEGRPDEGNFGIYTYAGDIGNVYAPYETYTPVTFVGDTDEVDLPAVKQPEEPKPVKKKATALKVTVTKKATTKKTGKVRVIVQTGKSRATKATGRVKVRAKAPGRKVVTTTVEIVRGKVVVKLPKARKKGTYRVRATYTGNVEFKASKKVVKVKVKR